MGEEKKEFVKKEYKVEVTSGLIQNMVYEIRGQQVMLDSDLALLYQVETKRLNEAAKRNSTRFPEEFRFQLAENEFDTLRSQFATSKEATDGKGGRRYMPFVFTEQGIAMLSAVLRSDVAVQVSINIMKTFVAMRKFMANNSLMFERISALEVKQIEQKKEMDSRFEQVFDYIAAHEESEQKVFFDGQIYDAFSLLVNLVESAKSKIVLVDNYVDVNTLNILAKKKSTVKVSIYTIKYTKLTSTDIDNFNKQYPDLEVQYTGTFHDRFLIVDNEKAYHIGASLKDAGKKCFAVSLLKDKGVIKDILQRLELETDEIKA